MEYETIQLVKENRRGILTLNRPQAMNAMNDVMMKELADCLESLQNDAEIQVLIIRGEGKAFSAGGDIKAMVNPDAPMDMSLVMGDITRLAKNLYTLPMITIASVHGASAGLGFSLALGCDIVIAEENAKLAMNFIGIGLVPDGAGHFFLKERVGIPKAKQLIWSGKVMTGHEALSLGLIDEVVAEGKAFEHAEITATGILHAPVKAMIASKQILHTQNIHELERILSLEATSQVAMRKSTDHLEGIQAFVEKRKPSFKGE
ncbi:enoyl-CoA hydratase [Paenisporosarcina cavernae]|uniref:Enoyl-CoA hydratase n=1 Tax=Paenisporosarcina cavernae TaxID=2320858 RepID=A0A385YUM9_9BACL|nr:enoyl-CoA hydratase [Paenisporosarcina cavernae]AYC30181.1 enoyl-CoA hydratase [Paenisporosarcina cavernae]